MMAERGAYLTDDWTVSDHLHFGDFRPALRRILLEANTPLTVGVFGPWGSGKTSLLRMLYREIQDAGLAYVRPMWFTAWKYDRQESLWRTFMLRVIDALYPRQSEPRDSPREQRPRLVDPADEGQHRQVETLDRLEASVYRPVDWQEMGRLVVDWLAAGKRGAGLAREAATLFIPGAGLVDKLFNLADLDAGGRALLKREMQTFHRQQLLEMEQFEDSFAEAIHLILGKEGVKGRLIVFVDDLDRCLPEKAIEVLEAIKLFLSVPGAVFVLGMDREVIQRGIEARYGSYFRGSEGEEGEERGELPIRGDTYLQKLIQIPFYLPPLSIGDLDGFIGDLGAESGARLSPLTRRVFARGLFPNPRQVKRALNIFQLLREIADQRIAASTADGRPRLAPEAVANPLLAKTVMVQTQFPKLYTDWRRYPTLLRSLEEELVRQPLSEADQLRGWRPARKMETPPAGGVDDDKAPGDETESRTGGLLNRYLGARQKYALLEQMLRYPEEIMEDGERGRFEGLDREQMAVYIRLAGAVTQEEAIAEVAVDLQADLLSNDWSKIRDALEGLDPKLKEDPRPLVDQLLRVIEDRATAVPARASAGYALGLLGDPRPGVLSVEPEMVPITDELRFQMGDEKTAWVDIDRPYAIGRYPVTNAQFRAFVEDGGYKRPEWLERCWTAEGRAYREKYSWTQPRYLDDPLWALDNLPVVGVSWYEALAYTNWLRITADKPYRLPTEAEWERAARYNDRRLYPWGDEWAEGLANTEEAGLERTTAVGIFVSGRSREGVADLAGNVQEWCQTRYRDKSEKRYPVPYRDGDGREELGGDEKVWRTVKGGSWFFDKDGSHCGARFGSNPYYRYEYLGFRLVLSPFHP